MHISMKRSRDSKVDITMSNQPDLLENAVCAFGKREKDANDSTGAVGVKVLGA